MGDAGSKDDSPRECAPTKATSQRVVATYCEPLPRDSGVLIVANKHNAASQRVRHTREIAPNVVEMRKAAIDCEQQASDVSPNRVAKPEVAMGIEQHGAISEIAVDEEAETCIDCTTLQETVPSEVLVQNLLQRFSCFDEDRIRDTLRMCQNHAGQAAAILREQAEPVSARTPRSRQQSLDLAVGTPRTRRHSLEMQAAAAKIRERKKEEKNKEEAKFVELCARFPTVNPETVRKALDAAEGHKGAAMNKLWKSGHVSLKEPGTPSEEVAAFDSPDC